MRKIIFLVIFLLAFTQLSLAETVFKVEINQSGDALWTLEKQITLTKPEITEWENMIQSGQNITRYSDVSELRDIISYLNSSARNFSNRSMEVREMNLSFVTVKTMSGGYGIIRYNFTWKNFSYNESGKIIIGDAFYNETIISPDIVLIIKIPEGYDIESITPVNDKREGTSLIWENSISRQFARGEPAIVLSRNVTVKETEIQKETQNWLWIIAYVIALIILAFLVLKWKSGKRKKVTETFDIKKPTEDEGQQEDENEDETPQITDAAGLPFEMSDEFLKDEERIEKFLNNSGGQVFQSKIVEEMGVSKSKVSIVLAKMKENGRIIKIRKGKENIIRLVSKKDTESEIKQ